MCSVSVSVRVESCVSFKVCIKWSESDSFKILVYGGEGVGSRYVGRGSAHSSLFLLLLLLLLLLLSVLV